MTDGQLLTVATLVGAINAAAIAIGIMINDALLKDMIDSFRKTPSPRPKQR